MSQENVEIVRATFDAWNAGDMDALRELYEPDVVLRIGGGLAGARDRTLVATRSCATSSRFVTRGTTKRSKPIDDFIDVADHVLVRHLYRGGWQRPRVEDASVTVVYTIRNGRVSLQEFFWNHSGSPRRRWPLGVGDVAGERGDRADRSSTPSTRMRLRTLALRAGPDPEIDRSMQRPRCLARRLGPTDMRRVMEAIAARPDQWDDYRLELVRIRSTPAIMWLSDPSASDVGHGSGVEVGQTRSWYVCDVPQRQGRASGGCFGDRARGPRSRGPVGARRSRRLLSLRDTARAMAQGSRLQRPRILGGVPTGNDIENSSSPCLDPSVEYHSVMTVPGGAAYHGPRWEVRRGTLESSETHGETSFASSPRPSSILAHDITLMFYVGALDADQPERRERSRMPGGTRCAGGATASSYTPRRIPAERTPSGTWASPRTRSSRSPRDA